MTDFILALTDIDTLHYILYLIALLVGMRLIEWTISVTKFLYRFFAQFFPTDIQKR